MTKRLPQNAREWKIAAASAGISGAVVGGAVYGIELATRAHGIPEIEDVGTLLSGIGNIGIAFGTIGIAVGGFISFQRWEDKRARKRYADLAEDVLMFVIDVCWLMLDVARCYPRAIHDAVSERKAQLERLTAPELIEHEEKLKRRVRMFLNDDSRDALRPIWMRRANMVNLIGLDIGGHRDEREKLNDTFDREYQEEIDQEWKAARKHFRELAFLKD